MRTHLPLLRVVGQVQDTYVVAEGPDGLYLLDQHAAHERVVYDRLIAGSGSGRQPRPLLQPQPAELTPSQEEMMRTHGDLLNQYGFIIEPFGDRSYLVRAVPEVASGADPAKALVEVLDLAALQGGLRDREEAVTASIACHSAVRAGQRLTQQEMEELVTQLDQADNPHTCPHGRPTMVHLSAHHLEREFGRR
jgi:DNA mismatch repair protein MutL